MFFATHKASIALSSVFFFLWITFLLLAAGEFTGKVAVHKAGGYFGIVTALCAYYTGAAGLYTAESSYVVSLLSVTIGIWTNLLPPITQIHQSPRRPAHPQHLSAHLKKISSRRVVVCVILCPTTCFLSTSHLLPLFLMYFVFSSANLTISGSIEHASFTTSRLAHTKWGSTPFEIVDRCT